MRSTLQGNTMSQNRLTLSDIISESDYRKRQSKAIDLFNQSLKNNPEITRALCDFVVGDPLNNRSFSPGFKLHCLNWLIDHHLDRCDESYEQHPEDDSFPEGFDDLIDCQWKFKWIIPMLARDLFLDKKEIEEANETMRYHYENMRFSLSSFYKTLMLQNILTGDHAAAKENFQKWQQTAADEFSDCPACEQSEQVNFYHFIGQYQKAIDTAQPILTGEMAWAEVPPLAYYPVIDSMIRLGKYEEAERLLDEAIDKINVEEDEEFVRLIPLFSQLAYKLGQSQRALDLMNRHGDTIIRHAPNDNMLYLDYLIALSPFDEKAAQHAREFAADFDKRNGNSYYQSQIEFMFGSGNLQ